MDRQAGIFAGRKFVLAGGLHAGRGVNVVVSEDGVSIELHVIVAYGVSIRAVAQNVLESVRYKIEEFTGLKVEKINVIVDGVRIVDED